MEWSDGDIVHDSVDCECGDTEEFELDPRCSALTTWRLAIVHDEGAHGWSLVRYLTEYEDTEYRNTHPAEPVETEIPGQGTLGAMP